MIERFEPAQGFGDFVANCTPRLLRAAWLLTGDEGKAEDLVQTALARTWPHWRRVSERGNPEAYVRRVLFTTHATWWRRRWRAETPVSALPDQALPGDASDEVVGRDVVRAALAELTRAQRAVVLLRFVEDLSEAETAELLDCSIGTVKSQTSRALARLRANNALRAMLTEEMCP